MGKNPAKLFGLYGRKGAFEIGFDADIVILDPEKTWTISKETLLTKNKVSAFEGVSGKGFPVRTIVPGKTVAQDGMYKDVFGHGELLRPVDFVTHLKKSKNPVLCFPFQEISVFWVYFLTPLRGWGAASLSGHLHWVPVLWKPDLTWYRLDLLCLLVR
jgi:hypothetical protein